MQGRFDTLYEPFNRIAHNVQKCADVAFYATPCLKGVVRESKVPALPRTRTLPLSHTRLASMPCRTTPPLRSSIQFNPMETFRARRPRRLASPCYSTTHLSTHARGCDWGLLCRVEGKRGEVDAETIAPLLLSQTHCARTRVSHPAPSRPAAVTGLWA